MEESSKTPKLYGPLASILLAVSIYLVSQVVAGILITIIPLLKHWSIAQTEAWVNDYPWAAFGFTAMVDVCALTLVYSLIKPRGLSFWHLGLNKFRLKHLLYAFAGFAAYFLLYLLGLIVAKALVPGLNLDQKQELGFNTAAHGIALIPIFLSLVLLPPITEEIVARGFLFGGLRTKLRFSPSAFITSLLFAAAHLGEGGKDGLLWVAAIDTFVLSLALCYLREKTGSLWPSIGLHMIKNGLAFVVLFSVF